jgi:hypothetical protein
MEGTSGRTHFSRRQAFRLLGLAAAVAYVAPNALTVSEANAQPIYRSRRRSRPYRSRRRSVVVIRTRRRSRPFRSRPFRSRRYYRSRPVRSRF